MGVLHGQGKDAIEFYTDKKVFIERCPNERSRTFLKLLLETQIYSPSILEISRGAPQRLFFQLQPRGHRFPNSLKRGIPWLIFKQGTSLRDAAVWRMLNVIEGDLSILFAYRFFPFIPGEKS
jgi:hypothetical protein